MKEDTRPLMVTIRCITYNHEPYIRQCLEGFVMQKTNFRFEAIVHDDASTDGTAAIIREYAEKYPDIIKPIIETENQYAKGGFPLIGKIMQESFPYGKYLAECEGDDYWIDPLKLQKQVDFLENHPDYGLVYTVADLFEEKSQSIMKSIGSRVYDFEELLIDNVIPTVTVCLRSKLYFSYKEDVMGNFSVMSLGDYPFWLYCALKSKIYFLNEKTAIYRKLVESASHSQSKTKILKYYEDIRNIKLYYLNNFSSKVKNYMKIRRIIDDQFSWVKYRIYIHSHDYKSAELMEEEYRMLSCSHKTIYIINSFLTHFGVSI